MKQKEAVLILPTQLFEKHPLLDQKQSIFLVEFERYFTAYRFHKQKLILHRATMQMYTDFLKTRGHTVYYIVIDDAQRFSSICKQKKINVLHCLDPVDLPFEKYIHKELAKQQCDIIFYETPLFLSPITWLNEQFAGKEKFRQQSFYIAQRKRMNILIKNGKPVGGSWSFDSLNRKPLPKNITIPSIYKPRQNRWVSEAQQYIEKKFSDHPGVSDPFIYPTTFASAKRWLDDFLVHRLHAFGPYQDAMAQDKSFLFHSILSPLLNIGLITPAYALEQTLNYAKKHKVPINSLEGFIRQLIGWREFVRAVYLFAGQEQRKSNFFNHRRKLPQSFWHATTGIDPIDSTINSLLSNGYTHHILRLMLLGNFMLLCEIKPDDVYRWFMELFIDAYDWVMVPNVYGMSQYADGGLMTPKPYISSSNYILKMSNFAKGDWCTLWDALYWHFVYKKRTIIKKTPRLAQMAFFLKRMKPNKLNTYLAQAEHFLKTKKI